MMQAVSDECMNMLLQAKEEDRPTAFIAATDYIGLHLVNSFRQLGLRVPEDIAVIGCDNTFFAEMVTPPLTSIDFSKEEFAKTLANTMTDLIEGKSVESKFLPVSLVLRGSV